MDNIDNETTSHTVEPHGNVSEHFKNNNSNNNTNTNISTTSTLDTDAEDTSKHRHCVSLPLYYDQVSCGIWFLALKLHTVSNEENKNDNTNKTKFNSYQSSKIFLTFWIVVYQQHNTIKKILLYPELICVNVFSLFFAPSPLQIINIFINASNLNELEWELILSFPERISS